MVCNSGVGLTPMVDGVLHHFSAGGLYNGLVLMIDDETGSYWDHITGEALRGPHLGKRVEVWPIDITTVGAALERQPELTISISKPPLFARLQGLFTHRQLRGKGFLPPFFRATMEEQDERLPTMAHGLGVVVDERARFYPMAAIGVGIEDDWEGVVLSVRIDELDQTPVAVWPDGARPFQLLTRWYGFSFTFPGCDIFATEVGADS